MSVVTVAVITGLQCCECCCSPCPRVDGTESSKESTTTEDKERVTHSEKSVIRELEDTVGGEHLLTAGLGGVRGV